MAVLDSFKDGLAPTAFAGGEFQFAPGSFNIDFESEPGVIQPQTALQDDIGDPSDKNGRWITKASNGNIYMGYKNASNEIAVGTLSQGSNSTVSQTDSDTGNDQWADGTPVEEWKDYLWAYDDSSLLAKFGDITGSPTISLNVGSVTTGGGLDLLATKSFLYYINKNSVGRASGVSTFNATALTLDSSKRVRSLAPFGQYIIPGVATQNEASFSELYLWDGISSILDGQPVVIPDTGLRVIRNVGGHIIIICVSNPNGGALENIIRFYRWSGGSEVRLINQLNLQSTVTNSFTIHPGATVVKGRKLYFAVSGQNTNAMAIDNGVYSITPEGRIALEFTTPQDTADTTALNFLFLKWVGDKLNSIHINDDGTTTEASNQAALNYSTNMILKTLWMRFDPVHKTQIDRIRFGMKSLPASTSIRVRHSADEAALATAKTFSTAATKEAKIENQTEYTFQPGNIHQLEFKGIASSGDRPAIHLPIMIEGSIQIDQQ